MGKQDQYPRGKFGASGALDNVIDGTGNQLGVNDLNGSSTTSKIDFRSVVSGESQAPMNTSGFEGVLFGYSPHQAENGSSYWLHRDPYSIINGDFGVGLDLDYNGNMC